MSRGCQLVDESPVLEDLNLFDEIDFIAHFHDIRKGQFSLDLLLGWSEINTVDGSVIGIGIGIAGDTVAIVAIVVGFSQVGPLRLTECIAHDGRNTMRRNESRWRAGRH